MNTWCECDGLTLSGNSEEVGKTKSNVYVPSVEPVPLWNMAFQKSHFRNILNQVLVGITLAIDVSKLKKKKKLTERLNAFIKDRFFSNTGLLLQKSVSPFENYLKCKASLYWFNPNPSHHFWPPSKVCIALSYTQRLECTFLTMHQND